MTLNKPDLPMSIKITNWHFELIEVYLPKPMRCVNCQRIVFATMTMNKKPFIEAVIFVQDRYHKESKLYSFAVKRSNIHKTQDYKENHQEEKNKIWANRPKNQHKRSPFRKNLLFLQMFTLRKQIDQL